MVYYIPSFFLLFSIILCVILIISDHRFSFEKYIKKKYRIDREWWLPPLFLSLNFLLGYINFKNISSSFYSDFDIIILVLTLALFSEGLRISKFFRYLAYRIVYLCRGNTYRLILYMTILISISTVFTTNDIIILVFTPIIIEICYQAKIKNTKPLLLFQFIVANTFSMASLIGSPTNIIVSEELNINFLSYYTYMVIPTIISLISTVFLLYAVLRLDMFDIRKEYEIEKDLELNFNKNMRNWIILFSFLVLLTIIVTYLNMSLYICSIPSIIIAMYYWYITETNLKIIFRLPYGILFFGMSFFIFADAFAQKQLLENIIPILNTHLQDYKISIIYGIFGSSIMVNIFNDIPASALIAEILSNTHINSELVKFVLTQSILIGLNIGKYITQIGALAGILWFATIYKFHKYNKKKYAEFSKHIQYPKRKDLLKFGLLNFITLGTILTLSLIIEFLVLSLI